MADFEFIKNWTTEDDYVERGGICEELTVEITLREYRGLIEEKVKQAAEIERLTAERDKFEKMAKDYGAALIAKHPDMVARINEAAREMLGVDPEHEDDEPAEIKCPCHLRDHMDQDDCASEDCNDCCPLRAADKEADAE